MGIKIHTLTTGAQNFTASWVDLGSELFVSSHFCLGLWVNIDINDTLNVRIRALAKQTSGGVGEYVLPIETKTASASSIEDKYFEFADDSDQKVLLMLLLNRIVPYAQIQIQAGTVGVSAGQILDSQYTLN